MVRLTLLGGVRVCRGTSDDAAVQQQAKRLGLLTYLAAARPFGTQRRDTIVALLWPDLDAGRARSALRQALHALRKSIGADAFVSGGSETIELNPVCVSCDLWDLEAAAQRGDHGRAVSLYTGELARGLHMSDAPAFEHWLDAERRRVRALARDSAWRAAETALAEGRGDDVTTFVSMALSLADLDEPAIRRGMRMLAEVGDRASALSAFEQFSADLRRELEIAPSQDTTALAKELRARDTRLSPTMSPPSSPRSPEPRHPGGHTSKASMPPARRRWRPTGRVAVATALSLFTVAVAARLAPSEDASVDPRLVHIERVANESDAAFDTLARSAEIALRAVIAGVTEVTLASGRDAGTRVRGSLRAVGDSLELRAEIVSRATGHVARSVATRIPRLAAESAPIDRFAERVAASLAAALYPGWGNALSQPRSYDAYRQFVEGMRRIKLEQHEAAVTAFRAALTEDSTFTAAGLMTAAELLQMGRLAAADSIVADLAPRRALLPTVDAHLLDWLARSLSGDRVGARSSMQALAEAAPDAELAWLQLAIDDIRTARPRSALAALERITPSGGDGWPAYWATRADAYHMVGDFQRELDAGREGLRLHPNLRVLVTYEVRALAALGRLAEVDSIVALLSEQPAVHGADVTTTMRLAALELAAHGNTAAAAPLLRRALAWYDARPTGERATLAHLAGRGRTLYLLDEREAARAAYEALLREHPGCLDCVGALGVLAARERDSAGAARAAAALSAATRPYLFGRHRLWLARMDATLGKRASAVARLTGAYASGAELDAQTHVDPDLRTIGPELVYRAFVRATH